MCVWVGGDGGGGGGCVCVWGGGDGGGGGGRGVEKRSKENASVHLENMTGPKIAMVTPFHKSAFSHAVTL